MRALSSSLLRNTSGLINRGLKARVKAGRNEASNSLFFLRAIHPALKGEFFFLWIALTHLSACSSMQYLLQAGQGQFEILNRAQPVTEVIQNEKTSPRLKNLLQEIEPIKRYGEKRGLKATHNYQEYVSLHRNAAVWVVSASERLTFKSKEWTFPIVGSFPFLGWFDRNDAEKFADEIRKSGLDVDVRGAAAYSTLGWFRDPLLSTMISDKDDAFGNLVNVILHESVHATLYIKNQSYLNESIASFIADHLTLEYIDQSRGAQSKEKTSYLEYEKRSDKIIQTLHEAYEKLDALYHSTVETETKLEEKKKILSTVTETLSIKKEINNATLVQYKTYNTGKKELDDLLKCSGSDWTLFLSYFKNISEDSFSKPNQSDLTPVLTPLIQKHCH